MKNYLFLLGLLIFASCETEIKMNKTIPTDSKPADELLSAEELTEFIYDYYHASYKQHKLERVDSDSSMELSYLGKIEGETDERWLINVNIPKSEMTSANFMGDLNKDGQEDRIIIVHTEGGGTGGNYSSDDYFVFLSQNYKYQFSSITSNKELSGCPGNDGYFIPNKIEGGRFLGESYCYAEGDGRCCPSLHFDTEVILKDNKLILDKKISSPSPEENQ